MNESQTLKIRGIIDEHQILALIDSGANHNFMSVETAAKLALHADKTDSFWVRLGDGSRRQTMGMCKAVTIQLEGVGLLVDFHIFPLGGVDVILGVSWLRTLGNINLNWDNLSMEFRYKDQKVLVKGVTERTLGCKSENSQHLLTEDGLWGLILSTSQLQQQLVPVREDGEKSKTLKVQQLLKGFETVFNEPHGLPPHRNHEHQIIIKDGVSPVNVRPYRYTYAQKNEMENMVTEMLNSGIIRDSHSPYSSPVILVKKKDGS